MAIGDVMRVRVVTVGPDASVRAAVLRMLEEQVGSVAVCEQERIVGIFTERDVLRLAGNGVPFDEIRIGDVMTTELTKVSPDTSIVDAAGLMGARKIRHLPVVEDDRLLGLVGIRDVLGALVERLWQAHDERAHETARSLFKQRT